MAVQEVAVLIMTTHRIIHRQARASENPKNSTEAANMTQAAEVRDRTIVQVEAAEEVSVRMEVEEALDTAQRALQREKLQAAVAAEGLQGDMVEMAAPTLHLRPK